MQKPVIKWVGGKTQLLDKLIPKIPTTMNNYHEIFLGGGSVLFALLTLQSQGKIKIKEHIYAYDINENLINMYKHIQNDKDELFEYIQKYLQIYDSITQQKGNKKPKTLEEAMSSKESYYYWIREQYNQMEPNNVERSALFMFLNKTCFRGLYREGPHGFNVPYGHYKKTPNIITRKELDNVSKLIQHVEFVHCGFDESMKHIKKGDFAYFDPPYAPETSKSFVGYVSDGFDLSMHESLFNKIKSMKNVKFVLSNAKVDLVTKSFEDYSWEDVKARRAINSKNPEATTTEVIIYN